MTVDTYDRRASWRLALRNPLTLISAVILAVIVLAALTAVRSPPYRVIYIDVPNALQPPSRAHLLVTDELGRDIFSRVLVGTHASLEVAAASVTFAFFVGVTLGAVAGYRGGWLDTVLMRVIDVMFAFPVLLLALAIVAVLSPGSTTTILAIGIVYTPIFARVARASTLSVRIEPFVAVSRTLGTGNVLILRRHILPDRQSRDCADLAVAGVRDPVGGGVVVFGARPPAARAVLGADAFRRARLRASGVVDERVPRIGDIRDSAGVQLAGRRTTRRTRPEAAHTARCTKEAMRKVALSTRDLRVRIGAREILRGISLEVEHGQTLGIVGESGSGKSMTVLAATGLLDAPGAEVTGSSVLMGEAGSAPVQLVGASGRVLRTVHGGRIGFVFQDPGTSLNPLLTLERQISESLEAHRGLTRRSARARALELLDAVGLPDPAYRLNNYPHQLSGGQRQRVMIAIALACDPELLIADEPTTALDVTTQAQIIQLVRQLQRDFGAAVVW
jgi:peptide/nickel transport system permease protein